MVDSSLFQYRTGTLHCKKNSQFDLFMLFSSTSVLNVVVEIHLNVIFLLLICKNLRNTSLFFLENDCHCLVQCFDDILCTVLEVISI